MFGKTVTAVFVIALVIVLVAIGPILTIWALNTLFPVLAIAYTLETWAAVIVVGMFLRSNVKVSKKD
jgi:ribosomal protein RSM22 (predicted rRNA methylase)